MTVRSAVLLTFALTAHAADLSSAIRAGDRALVAKMIAEGADVNAPARGLTPLIQAVVTSDRKMVQLLIAKGADPKAPGESGLTALHAAVFDFELTEMLLAAGADPNAATTRGQTPLFGAVARSGNGPVVGALLKAGANPNALVTAGTTKNPPLRTAIQSADPDIVRRLLEAGADISLAGGLGRNAMASECAECLALVLKAGYRPTAQNVADAASPGTLEPVKLLVEAGAPLTGVYTRGYTPLMHAAMSYRQNPELVKYLLVKGADPAAKNEVGDSALAIARRFGKSAIVKILEAAEAPGDGNVVPVPQPVRENTVADAIRRGIPLVEKSAPAVFQQRGCVSCHNNTQTAMTVAMARQRGFTIDEALATKELQRMASDGASRRQLAVSGLSVLEIPAYILLALDTAGRAADSHTDLAVHSLAFRQLDDGHWPAADYRPPQEYSDIATTALALRALDVYAPPGRAAEMKERVARAGAWLASATPHGAEEHAMRLLGLRWAGKDRGTIERAVKTFLAFQGADGGWAQLPGMDPDAYATGLALYALHLGGGLPVTHAAYRRGVRFLLETQRPDGSWFVETRAFPIQPYFESGFPYGNRQWISAAGTNWALQSLLLTMPLAHPAATRAAD